MRGDPDVVKFLIREKRRDDIEGVTGAATPLALKQGPAAFGLIADGLIVSRQEVIEWRVSGILRPLESRDRGGDVVVSGIAPEKRFERLRIFRDLGNFGDDIVRRLLAHFNGIQNRKLGLILKGGRPAVPELRGLKHRVQHVGRIALAMLVLDARGGRAVVAMIGKSLGGIVTGRAGNRVVDRKPLVVEQFFAKRGKLQCRLAAARHSQGVELRRNAKGQGGFEGCLASRLPSALGRLNRTDFTTGAARSSWEPKTIAIRTRVTRRHRREAGDQFPARSLHSILPMILPRRCNMRAEPFSSQHHNQKNASVNPKIANCFIKLS